MALRLLLLSVEGTVGHNGTIQMTIAHELGRLARELASLGVTTALWSNREWTVEGKPLARWFSEIACVEVLHHGARVDASPSRQTKNSAFPIMERYRVQPCETALVGSVKEDMIAGVQNKLLLLRPTWYGQHMDYGFPVETIGELARFCFVFGLRRHPLFWRIQDGSLDVSAAGPFSTYKAAYQMFGEDAKAFAKGGKGSPNFWFNFAVSSMYFSGLLEGVNYICSYPGHSPDSDTNKFGMADVLAKLGKCFGISYYNDLIVRHKEAAKSQPIKAANRQFLTQLNSIHLATKPHRNLDADAVKTAISLRGKTVLVVDDFCTSGRSNEAGRVFIEAAGGRARLFSWLKTINTPYTRIASALDLVPFRPNCIGNEPSSFEYDYFAQVVADNAPVEIHESLRRYQKWEWT